MQTDGAYTVFDGLQWEWIEGWTMIMKELQTWPTKYT